MREKRYSKDMKGTQEKEKERYPLLDVFPLKRKATREINERVGGVEEIFMEFVEDGQITEYVNTLKNWKQYLLVMLPFLLRHCSRACRP